MSFNKGYELKKFEAHWEKLRQSALCQRREPEGNPRVAGAQRYQHHQQYLYPSGFLQQGVLCQCHRQHFPGEHKGMICNKNKAARNLKKVRTACLVPVVGVEPTRVISTRDFESPSSAIPTHRRIVLNVFYYTGFPGQNQEKVCVFFQIVPHGVKYMPPVLARRRRLCYTKVRSKRK